MKKRIYLSIIILILIFIILSFFNSKKQIFDDIAIFNLWSDSDDYEFKINPQEEPSLEIDVFQTGRKNKKYNKKIAPGSRGSFVIKLTKPLNAEYEISLKNITNKPQNLVFILDNRVYNSVEELQDKLNIIFQNQNTATIKWNWNYENNYTGNIIDTKDGEIAQKYIFEVKALIKEEDIEE